ncbi:MAG: hypothetical protein V4773_22780, partial [Verrucomicrobiota bacterium]
NGLLAAAVMGARLYAAGDLTGAAQALGFASLLTSYQPDEWALADAVAQLLAAAGRPAQATDIYRALFAAKNLPAELRLAWLPHAVAAAQSAHDSAQASTWSAALADLTPAPSPPPATPTAGKK